MNQIPILESYLGGQWVAGSGAGREVFHAIHGNVISLVNTDGLDFLNAIGYGKSHANKLQRLDIHQRALMVKAVASHLYSQRAKFYAISYQTGATKADSWIDIEGGINTMFAISSMARKNLAASPIIVEDDLSMLSKHGSFIGKHILSPKEGVALHINSFNFPCWGMLEKLAGNWIAGVPAIVKPASDSAYLTKAMVESIIEANILPQGALQLVSGSLGNMLDYLDFQDTVTFTGSSDTAFKIRSNSNILKNNIIVNIEADSLNACVLGEDVRPNDLEFELFVQEVAKEMTTKAGQRCTCIRRIFVPEHLEPEVTRQLSQLLASKQMGDPNISGVEVGALISKKQVAEVAKSVEQLKQAAQVVYQSSDKYHAEDPSKGAFYPLTLLRANDDDLLSIAHQVEAFGPVSTVFSYQNMDQAAAMLKAGRGSLVSSVFSNDLDHLNEWVKSTASYNGRMLLINRDNHKESTGHGTVMPHMTHGGPGKAGGGEELGGVRCIKHYMQRTAIQASPDMLTRITDQWVPGATKHESEQHPFRKYYEDLQVGDSLTTHRRTVTEADIVNFAAISGDHFYAHFDDIAAKNSLFKQRVAHGYFIVSAAAGLFVYPNEGPVLANYGLENLRFLEPLLIGDTIQARLTFIKKNKKPLIEGQTPHGVVYWDVSVTNQHNQSIASYEILTLVARRDYE